MQSVVDLLRALRNRVAAEHGGFMIEVVVSAALIVSAGGGVLIAMDAAGRQSSQQRLQAVAADVAQAEMERLRSQKFEYLIGLIGTPYTQSVPSGGNTFTVESRGEWEMQAPPGAVQCTNSARNPETLKISTTVTWQQMSRKPVRLTSLVAAPIGSGAQRGTYVVQITNRDGVGLPGISVALNGSTPVTGATDANGCVRFTDLSPGPYTIQFTKAGYIDHNGNAVVVKDVEVAGGQTRSQPFEIDRAGTAEISFRYDRDAGAGQILAVPAVLPASVSVDHALTVPNHQTFTRTAETLTTPNLYPFGGGYTIYGDSCINAAPTSGPTNMVIDPAVFNKAITLQLPVLRVETDADGGTVHVRTACGTHLPGVALTPGAKRKDPAWVVAGLPWGRATHGFAVCVVGLDDRWRIATTDNTTYGTPTTVVVNNLNGTGTPCGSGWPTS